MKVKVTPAIESVRWNEQETVPIRNVDQTKGVELELYALGDGRLLKVHHMMEAGNVLRLWVDVL